MVWGDTHDVGPLLEGIVVRADEGVDEAEALDPRVVPLGGGALALHQLGVAVVGVDGGRRQRVRVAGVEPADGAAGAAAEHRAARHRVSQHVIDTKPPPAPDREEGIPAAHHDDVRADRPRDLGGRRQGVQVRQLQVLGLQAHCRKPRRLPLEPIVGIVGGRSDVGYGGLG